MFYPYLALSSVNSPKILAPVAQRLLLRPLLNQSPWPILPHPKSRTQLL